MTTSVSAAGFADPVLDAQACFRALLTAMSRPGSVHRLEALPETPPGISPAAASLLLTLVDPDSSLALAAGPEAVAWVTFHTSVPLVAVPAARFVLDGAARLRDLDPGSEEEPERGATLILEVQSLAEGRGWRLVGPGVRDFTRLSVLGAPDCFLQDWETNRARFPSGVDVILCAGNQIAALPRSLTISLE